MIDAELPHTEERDKRDPGQGARSCRLFSIADVAFILVYASVTGVKYTRVQET